jgi:hypothetical protein
LIGVLKVLHDLGGVVVALEKVEGRRGCDAGVDHLYGAVGGDEDVDWGDATMAN